jgi:hypothetical protein
MKYKEVTAPKIFHYAPGILQIYFRTSALK